MTMRKQGVPGMLWHKVQYAIQDDCLSDLACFGKTEEKEGYYTQSRRKGDVMGAQKSETNGLPRKVNMLNGWITYGLFVCFNLPETLIMRRKLKV